ncbi:MAG TPA: Uma2 family endonuclease [Labilithrix sp.]|nr:Uma2 family endonuclease [Labilithrix sp.]
MSTTRASALLHVRPAEPLHFPEQEPESERGQGRRHLKLCHALFEMLCAACVPEHTVGADQFVYFDAADPRRCLVPDAFVTLGVPDHDFDSSLVWEEGTPAVAFEVLSPSDSPERWTFEEKLRRYRALGVDELVTVHLDAPPGERLRVWDRLEHDLVERVVEGDRTPCLSLGLTVLVGPVNEYPVGVRLARDADGRDLVLTEREGRAAEAKARAEQRVAQQRLEERNAELERELAARDGRAADGRSTGSSR